MDRRLLSVAGYDTMVLTSGPVFPDGSSVTLASASNPNAVSFMEWSNSLVRIMDKQGQEVECRFTKNKPAKTEIIAKDVESISVRLRVRRFFDGDSAALARDLLQPGELTQGLRPGRMITASAPVITGRRAGPTM